MFAGRSHRSFPTPRDRPEYLAEPCAVVCEMGSPDPRGKLVDIGGYKLNLDSTGAGRPSVVLIAGAVAQQLRTLYNWMFAHGCQPPRLPRSRNSRQRRGPKTGQNKISRRKPPEEIAGGPAQTAHGAEIISSHFGILCDIGESEITEGSAFLPHCTNI